MNTVFFLTSCFHYGDLYLSASYLKQIVCIILGKFHGPLTGNFSNSVAIGGECPSLLSSLLSSSLLLFILFPSFPFLHSFPLLMQERSYCWYLSFCVFIPKCRSYCIHSLNQHLLTIYSVLPTVLTMEIYEWTTQNPWSNTVWLN